MSYETFDVPVDGGTLRVGRWGSGDRLVIAAHGITANHLSMRPLADALGDDFTVLAPDLRGRGRSNQITGPFGMAAHADDLTAVLDHVGIDRAIVLGHSMGGFVAVVAANRHPDRVERLVLVDGGIPLNLGPLADLPVEELAKAIIGPALERLRMTFATEEEYLDYWQAHPALAGAWNEYVAEHYRYDLTGNPPELRSGVSEQAALTDAGDGLLHGDVAQALDELRHPAVLVRAPLGLMGQEPGLYTDDWVAEWTKKLPTMRDVLVGDVNHYTILLTEHGAKTVANIVRTG